MKARPWARRVDLGVGPLMVWRSRYLDAECQQRFCLRSIQRKQQQATPNVLEVGFRLWRRLPSDPKMTGGHQVSFLYYQSLGIVLRLSSPLFSSREVYHPGLRPVSI